MLSASGATVRDPFQLVRFGWPVIAVGAAAEEFGVHAITNFVDQDPTFPGNLLDYNCGQRTYGGSNPGYNHSGIDIDTWPRGWTWMDNDEVQIVAAAAGTIVFKQDGYYDESCSTAGGQWNAVFVEHADGSVAWYGRMKNGSPTSKLVGERVEMGEYLGVIGSSGR
ncbi:MAG: murein DD-endopeptidase MepM/ murein hydrolase activator NlpD [Chlamydiales bacterium]|jgi:murein DD-endopeptidase MepM/ murein hydrolase activator NlpD